MAEPVYYALVASLPRLPHFEQAEWLPLSRKQIEERLAMLDPEHRVQLRVAEGLVRWQRTPVTRTSEEVAANYRRFFPLLEQPALREFVQFRLGQRTALVALRRRRKGLPAPPPDEVWGVGPWVRRIRESWDAPDLGLGALLPGLEEASRLLQARDARGLERLLMESAWTRLSRTADTSPFGFESVMAFFFKWDILQRWKSYEAEAATTRFQELIGEVTRDHQQLFA